MRISNILKKWDGPRRPGYKEALNSDFAWGMGGFKQKGYIYKYDFYGNQDSRYITKINLGKTSF